MTPLPPGPPGRLQQRNPTPALESPKAAQRTQDTTNGMPDPSAAQNVVSGRVQTTRWRDSRARVSAACPHVPEISQRFSPTSSQPIGFGAVVRSHCAARGIAQNRQKLTAKAAHIECFVVPPKEAAHFIFRWKR